MRTSAPRRPPRPEFLNKRTVEIRTVSATLEIVGKFIAKSNAGFNIRVLTRCIRKRTPLGGILGDRPTAGMRHEPQRGHCLWRAAASSLAAINLVKSLISAQF